jgi:5-(carboxyamino)imidazole ribonucleotide synthase
VPHPDTALPVVGIIGAGQLARMTQQAAISLGLAVRVLADTPDDSAALVCRDVMVGDYRDFDDLAAFSAGCDVVTFDHEHVPLRHVERLVDSGVVVRPGPQALPFVQDKIRMRVRLGELGIAVPDWTPVTSVSEISSFAALHGWPVVAKAVSGGYDGKGVWVLASEADASDVVSHAAGSGVSLYVEEHVGFVRELAALVARSANGELRGWPTVQTVQTGGICTEVIAPAPDLPASLDDSARALAARIATELDVVGLLAVELFETAGGGLLVNELAMRPHNCGHWTIDGSPTSQFEQHLRAVLGWPLGDTGTLAPVTVMANLLGGSGPGAGAAELASRLPGVLGADPGAHLHLYGKGVRPGRKIGHVTVLGHDTAHTRDRAVRAVDVLRGGTA